MRSAAGAGSNRFFYCECERIRLRTADLKLSCPIFDWKTEREEHELQQLEHLRRKLGDRFDPEKHMPGRKISDCLPPELAEIDYLAWQLTVRGNPPSGSPAEYLEIVSKYTEYEIALCFAMKRTEMYMSERKR